MSRKFVVIGFTGIFVAAFGMLAMATAQVPISPAEKQIRDALDGEAGGGHSGDGVLDDILEIIQQRGSILDGSSLDPTAGEAKSSQGNEVSQNAYAAEQLLRAARLLEGLGEVDRKRAELVAKMEGGSGNSANRVD